MTTTAYPFNDGIMEDIRAAAAQRSRVIATIHAIADHLAAHPDIPTPRHLTLTSRPADHHDKPARAADAERLAELERFALQHDARRYGLDSSTNNRDRHEYAELRVDGDMDGFLAVYVMSTTIHRAAG